MEQQEMKENVVQKQTNNNTSGIPESSLGSNIGECGTNKNMDQNFNIEKQSGSARSWKEQRSESHYTDAESNVIDSEKCLELSPECEVANPTEFPNCTMGDLSSSNNSSILTSEHPANVLINQPNKDTEYIKRDFDVLSPPSGFEDDMSDPSETADDFFDADECTGFGTVESLDPPSTTPSVIEILAAMALGPMLAVPAADEPATLSAAELITMNELKNLALNEIKSRSYEMYPHSLGVIPEEMGEFDLKNFPTPDELENQINLALVDNSDIVVEKESPQTSANQIKFKTGCVEPQIVEAEIKPEILPINEPACVANAVQDISVMDPAVAEINYITTIKTEAKIDSEKVQIEQKVEPVVVQDSPQIEPEAVQIIEPVEKESQHKNIAETTCATILETTVQDISIINPAVAEINDNTTIAIEAKVDSEAVQIEQSVESSVVQESHQIEPEAQQIEPAAVQIIEPVEIKSQHADTAPTMCAAIPEHAVTKINDNPTIGIDAKVDSEIEIEQKVESVVVQNSQQIEPEAVRMIEPVERESQHADTARTTCASIPEPGIQDISIMDPAVAEINDNTTNRIAAKVDLETVQIEVQVESAVVQDSQQIEPAAVQIIKPVELTSQHADTEPTTCAAIPEPAVAEINDNTIIGTDAKVDSEKVQIEHKVESAVAQDSQQIEPEADQKIEQVEKESQHADNAPMTCAAIPAPAIHDISTMNPVVAEINDNTRIGIEAKVESETVQIEQTVESYVVLKSLQLEPEAVQIIEPVEIKSQHKNIAETTCAEIPEPTVAEINDNTTIRIKAIVDSETVQKEQKIEVAVVQDSQQIEPEAVQIIETVEKALQHAYTAPTTFAFVQDISIMDSAVAEINDSTTNGIAANIDSETVRIEYRTVESAVVQDSQQIEPAAVQIIEPDDIKSQHADTAPTTCAAIPEPAVPGINDNTTIGIVAVVQATQQIETEAVQIIEPVEKKSQHVNIAETTCATIPEAGVQGISTINPTVAEINDNTTIGIEAKVDTEPVQIEQKVESAVVQDSQQIEPAAVQIIEQVEKESQHADNAPTTCAAIPEAAIQDKSFRCTAVAEINENTKIGIEAKVGSEPVQIEQTVESSVVQESQQIEQETVQINEQVEIKSQPADTAPTIYAAIPEPTVAEINDNTTIRIEAIVDSETVQIEQKVESAVVQNSQQIEPEAVQIIEPVEKESQHANTAPTTRASIPEPEVQDICIMDPAAAEMNDDTIIGLEPKVDSEPVRIDQTDESSVVQESQIEPEAVQIIESIEIKSQHADTAPTIPAAIPESAVAEINDNTTIVIDAKVDTETVQIEQKVESAVVQDSQQIEPTGDQIIEQVKKESQPADTAPATCDAIPEPVVAEINDSTTIGIDAKIDSETVQIEQKVESAVVQDSQQIEPEAVHIIEPVDIKSQHADTAPTTCAAIPEPAVSGINDNTTIGIVAVVQDTQQIETEAVQIIEPVEKKSQHVNIAETTCATIPEAGVQGISTINPTVAEINDNTTIGIEAKVDTEPVQIEQKVESAVVQDSQQIEPAAVQIIEQVEKESQHADNAPTTCAAIPEAAIQDKSIRCTAVAEINENSKIGIEAKVGSEPVQIEQTVESSVVQESQQIEQETVQINEPVEIKSQPADTAPTIYAAIPEPTVAEINDNTTIRIEAIVDSETVQIEQKVESAVVQNSQQIEPEAVQIIEPVEKESQHANTAPTTRASIPEPEVQDICIMDPAVAEMNDDTIIGIEPKVDSEPVRIDQTDESSVVQESQIEPEAVQIIESIEIKSQHADTAPTIPAAIPESAVAEINDNTTIVIDVKVDTETVQIEQKVESAVVQDSQQIEPTGDQIIEQVKKESQPADTAPATCDAIPEPVVAEINDSTTIGIDAKIDSETVQIEQKVESAVVQDSQQIEPEAVHIIEPVDIKSQHADTAPTTCAAIPEPAVPGINDNTTIGIVAVVQDTQQIETEAVQIIEPVEKKSQHVNIAETTCATIPEAGVQGISTINPTVAEINDNTTIGIEAKVDTEPVQIEQKVESAVVQDSQQIEPAAVQIIEQVEKESQHADNAPTTCDAIPEPVVAEINDSTTIGIDAKIDSETVQIEQKVESAVVQDSQHIEPEAVHIIEPVDIKSQHADTAPTICAAIPEIAIQDKSIMSTVVDEINDNATIGIEAKVDSEAVQIEQTVESSVAQESQHIEPEAVQIIEPVDIPSQHADTAPTICAEIPEPAVAEINYNTTIGIDAKVSAAEPAVLQNSQQIEQEAVQIIEPVQKESQNADTAPTTCAAIPEPGVHDISIMDPAFAETNDRTTNGIATKVGSETVQIEQNVESAVVQDSQQIEPAAVQIIAPVGITSQHADAAPAICAALPERSVAEINDNTTIRIAAKVDSETVQIEQKVESAVVQNSQQIETEAVQIIVQVEKESQHEDIAPTSYAAIPEPVVAEINDNTTIEIDAKVDSERMQIEQQVESAVVQDSQHIEPAAVQTIKPVQIKSQHTDTAPTTCAVIQEPAVAEINDNTPIVIDAKVDSERVQIEQQVESTVVQDSQHIEPAAVQTVEIKSQHADTAQTTCGVVPEPAVAEINDNTTIGIEAKVDSEPVQIEEKVESSVIQDSQQIEPEAVQIIESVEIKSQHADSAPTTCAAIPEPAVAEINDNTTIGIEPKVDSETVQIEQIVESAVVQDSQQIEPKAVQITEPVEIKSQHANTEPTTYAAIPEPVVAEINDNTTIRIDAKVNSETVQIEQKVESAVAQDSQQIEPADVQIIESVEIIPVDSETVQIEQKVESSVIQDSQQIEPEAVQIIESVEIRSQHADTAPMTYAAIIEPAFADINDNTTIGIVPKVDSETVQIEQKVESTVVQNSQQIEPEAVQIIGPVEIKSQHADTAPTTCDVIPEPAVTEINDNATIDIDAKVDSERIQIERDVESAVIQDSQHIVPAAVDTIEPVEIKSQHADTVPTTCAAIPDTAVAEINDNTTIGIDAKVDSETVQIERNIEPTVVQDSQKIEPEGVQIIESVEIRSQHADTAPMTYAEIPEPAVSDINDNTTIGIEPKFVSETVQIKQKVESTVVQDSQQIEPAAVQTIEPVEIKSQLADTAPTTCTVIPEPAVIEINDNTTIVIDAKVDSERMQIEQQVESAVVQDSQHIEPAAVQTIEPVEIKSQDADTASTTCAAIPEPAVAEIDAKVEKTVESAVVQDSQQIEPAAVQTIEPVEIKSQLADTAPMTCTVIPEPAVNEINDNATIGIDAKVDSERVQKERDNESAVVQDSQHIEPAAVQTIEPVEIKSQDANTAPTTCAAIPEPAVAEIDAKVDSETVQIEKKVESALVQDSQHIEPEVVQIIEPVEIRSQHADNAPTTATAAILEPAVQDISMMNAEFAEINDNTTIGLEAKCDLETMKIEQKVESAVIQDSQRIKPETVQIIEPVEKESHPADTAPTTCAAIPEPAGQTISMMNPAFDEINDNKAIVIETKLDSETVRIEQQVESAIVQCSQHIEPAAGQIIEPVEIKSDDADTAPTICAAIPEPAVAEINDNTTNGIDAKVDSETVQLEQKVESADVQGSQQIEPEAVQTIEPVEIKLQHADTASTTCTAIPEPAVQDMSIMDPVVAEINDNTPIAVEAKLDSETEIEENIESAVVQNSQQIAGSICSAVQLIEPVEIKSQHADAALSTCTAIPKPAVHDINQMDSAVAEINDNKTIAIDAKIVSETLRIEEEAESNALHGSQTTESEAVQIIEPVGAESQHAHGASTICAAIPEHAIQDTSIMEPPDAEINDNTTIGIESKCVSDTEQKDHEVESAVANDSPQIEPEVVQIIEPVDVKSEHVDTAPTCAAIPAPDAHDVHIMNPAVADVSENITSRIKTVFVLEAVSAVTPDTSKIEPEAIQIVEGESQYADTATMACITIPEPDPAGAEIDVKVVSETPQLEHELVPAVAQDSSQIEPEAVQITEPVSQHADIAPTIFAAMPEPPVLNTSIMAPPVSGINVNTTIGIETKVISETGQVEHEVESAVVNDSQPNEPEADQVIEPVEAESQHANIVPTIGAAMPATAAPNTSRMDTAAANLNESLTSDVDAQDSPKIEPAVQIVEPIKAVSELAPATCATIASSQIETEAVQKVEPIKAALEPTCVAIPEPALQDSSLIASAGSEINDNIATGVGAKDGSDTLQREQEVKTALAQDSPDIDPGATQIVEKGSLQADIATTVCAVIPETAVRNTSLMDPAGANTNKNILSDVENLAQDSLQSKLEAEKINPEAQKNISLETLTINQESQSPVETEPAETNVQTEEEVSKTTSQATLGLADTSAQIYLEHCDAEVASITCQIIDATADQNSLHGEFSQVSAQMDPDLGNSQTIPTSCTTKHESQQELEEELLTKTCESKEIHPSPAIPKKEHTGVNGKVQKEKSSSQTLEIKETIDMRKTLGHNSGPLLKGKERVIQEDNSKKTHSNAIESKVEKPIIFIDEVEHATRLHSSIAEINDEVLSLSPLVAIEKIVPTESFTFIIAPTFKQLRIPSDSFENLDSFVPDEIGKLTESFKPPFITNTILNAECRQNVPYELSQFNVKTENQRTIEMAKMLDPKEIIIKNDTHVNMEPKPENILLSATNQIGEKTMKPHGLLHIENNSIIITKRTISSSESDVAETQIQSDIEESKNLIYNNSISCTSPLDLEDNGIIVITPQIWEESVVNVGSKTEDLKLHIDDSLVSKDNISRAVSALSLEKLDEARMHFVSNNDNNPMRSSPQTNSELNETIVLIRHEDIKTTESPKRISKSVIAENVMSHLEVKTEQAIYIESESLIHHDGNIILVAQGIPSKENIELKKVAELENNISPVGTSFNTESQSKRYISALGLKTDQSSTLSTEHLEFLTIEAKSTINSFEEQDEILSHHSTLCENVTTLDSVTTLPKLRDTSSQIESITSEQQFPDNTIIMHQKKNNLSEIRRHDQEEINPGIDYELKHKELKLMFPTDSISEESVSSANEARLHSSDALQTEKAIDAIPTYPVLRTEISEEITSPSDTCSCSNSMEGTLTGTMSEDLSPKTAVSKNNTSQCSLDLAAYDTKSFEDSTNFTRQSTTLEFEIDTHIPDNSENPVSATDSIARPLLASQSNFKKLKRQYGMECTTPSFEDGSQQLFEPPSLPPPLPYSGSNTLATICHQYIKDKHLLAALETRRRQTLLMHKFLSTIDSYHSNDETCGSIEDTSQAHAEVLQQKCENRTSPSPTTTTNPTLSPTPPPMTHGYGGVQGTTHHTSHRQCSEFNEDNGSDWFSVSVVDHFPISFNFINTILFSHDISHHSDNSGTVPSSRATSVEDIFTMTDDEKDILVHKKNTMRRRRRKSTPMMAVNRNTTTAIKKPSANRVKLNDKSSSGKKHTSISNSYLIPNKLTNSPDGYPRTEINYTATNPNTNSSTKSKACHKENSSEVVALPKLVSDSAKVEIDNSPGVSEISQKAHTETPKQHSESEHVLSSITNVVNLVSDQIEDERSKALVEGTSHEKEFISQTPKPKETEEFKSEKAKIVTQRPSSLNLGRKDSSGSACATPTRGSTPPAFKFLQPKRKLMDPSHILSFEEDEETQEATGGFSSEKPVIEKEVAHALPSVKALARAFLMTSAPTQRSHENVWLRKTKTLSASGKSPSTPVHSKGSHDLSIPTDSTNVGVPIKDGKTSEDTKDLDTNDNMSSSALSAATTTPTGNNNSNVLPVRKGVLKSNIAFFENLKNN